MVISWAAGRAYERFFERQGMQHRLTWYVVDNAGGLDLPRFKWYVYQLAYCGMDSSTTSTWDDWDVESVWHGTGETPEDVNEAMIACMFLVVNVL